MLIPHLIIIIIYLISSQNIRLLVDHSSALTTGPASS